MALMRFAAQKVPAIRQLRFALTLLPLLLYPLTTEVHAQNLRARIVVTSLSPARVLVEAQGPKTDTWSFRNIYAGIGKLADRVENFKVQAPNGSESVRLLAPGEFRSSKEISSFSYEVRLGERSRLGELSHVSWINPDRGLLMLADLLPQFGRQSIVPKSTTINFHLPPGWKVASALLPNKDQSYEVVDIDRSVFYVGHELRETRVLVDGMDLALITSGEWAFVDNEALMIAARIVKEHSKLTQHRLTGRSVVLLAPLDGLLGPDRWTAETRGASVVLLMGSNAGKRALLGRLGVVLAHELFHLWVPNVLGLKGDYDWFFEGFTLYQALLTCLRLNLIKFDDYLDTIARVYDSYRSLPDHDRLSLIEASEQRWAVAPSFVYDKGMLVALIHDLKLRQAGRNGTGEIYPQLFRHAARSDQDANEVIMSLLNQSPGMSQFFEHYVRNPGEIALDGMLAEYGLRLETKDLRTRILINKELTSEQIKLLGSVGYKR